MAPTFDRNTPTDGTDGLGDASSKKELESKLASECKLKIDKAKTRHEKKQIQREYVVMKDELRLSHGSDKKDEEVSPIVDVATWRQNAIAHLRTFLKDNTQHECDEVKERHEKQEVEYWFKRLDHELADMVKESAPFCAEVTPRSLPYSEWKQRHIPLLVRDLKSQCKEVTQRVEDTERKEGIVQEYRHLVHLLRGEVENNTPQSPSCQVGNKLHAAKRSDLVGCTCMEDEWSERLEIKRSSKAVGKDRCRERNDRRDEKYMAWTY